MKRIDPGYELYDCRHAGARKWRRIRKAVKRNLKNKERTAAKRAFMRWENWE